MLSARYLPALYVGMMTDTKSSLFILFYMFFDNNAMFYGLLLFLLNIDAKILKNNEIKGKIGWQLVILLKKSLLLQEYSGNICFSMIKLVFLYFEKFSC